MYMLRCWVKIFYYLLLIGYHVVDVFFDWYNYIHLFLEKTTSGVSNATNSTVAEFFFVFSCAVGSFISLFLVVLYLYYIKYHWYCIRHAGYLPVRCSDGKVSMLSDRRCDKKCDRRYVFLELLLSVLELLGKEDVQSSILFLTCTSQTFVPKLSGYFIALSACSCVAHIKLLICFVTKLLGYGASEKRCCSDGTCAKDFFCVVGIIGSVVFLVLTIVSLVKAVY